MLKQLKQALRDVSVWFFRLIGSEIQDCRTGERLGRGLIFYWGGRVHLLGCDCAGFFSANYNMDQVVGMALKEFEDVEVAHTGFRDASASGLRLHFPFALPKEVL